MKNAHFFIGLFVLTMGMTLILEQFWGKLIGICLGISLYLYLVAKKWIKCVVESVTGYFTKVYDLLCCIRFVQQDGVVETVKINTEIKMLKKSLMELMKSEKKCAKSGCSFVNNPGIFRKHANQKSNNVRVKTAAKGVQSNVGPSCKKNTASCLETYCYLCTFPKVAKRTTT